MRYICTNCNEAFEEKVSNENKKCPTCNATNEKLVPDIFGASNATDLIPIREDL